MDAELLQIPLREVLHFLGWRGTPVDAPLLAQIRDLCDLAVREVRPRMAERRFPLAPDGSLAGTSMTPKGNDVRAMLAPCREAVLLAATLGAESERLLLRMQAKDAAQALVLDAVLSAAIEAVLDAREEALRGELAVQGRYLTDRFSPGYGDMPLAQGAQILAVLDAQRRIGLMMTGNGLMVPRKSVTAVLGVSRTPVARRPAGCEGCGARETCALRRNPQRDRDGGNSR